MALLAVVAFAVGWLTGPHQSDDPKAPALVSLKEWTLIDRRGRQVPLRSLPLGSDGAIVYVMRRNCQWCSRNAHSVNALAEQLRGTHSAYGVILDGEWPKEGEYLFPLFQLSAAARARAADAITPTTLIVDARFRHVKQYSGAYVGSVRQTLMDALGVVLPEAL